MLARSLLSKILPLAEDPFPPTHKAGSEFEGFFLRLESHSGRCSSGVLHAEAKRDYPAKASPSRIPRLAKTSRNGDPSPQHLRRRRQRSSSASSSSSSSTPPSPTPRRISRDFAQHYAKVPPKTMLTDLDPVFASPESFLPRPTGSTSKRVQNSAASLPTSAPGDLILVVCELQSAPIDRRICIYLRWIVHGEEESLYHALHGGKKAAGEGLPNTAKGKERQSFEIVKYVPSWSLKVGRKVDGGSVQPFRIDLPDTDELGEGGGAGFFEVTPDGNVVVDLTLTNAERSEEDKQVGTRLRLRSTKHCPWRPSTPSPVLPMGTRGPEGWIQHLGVLLPLHWYVHSSSAPATFSLEHVAVSDASSSLELDNAVAAGRGLLHVEKNWGQAFPSGWMWCHGASPLPDPSLASSATELVRLSLAGGSILGLTAFLVGLCVGGYNWTFAPPTALGPQASFPSKGGARVHYGPGLRMRRDFTNKIFELDVWDLGRWARVRIEGHEQSFATQIPGPRKGGWTPGYCHHSYRCRASITLYTRSVGGLLGLPVKAGVSPLKSLRSIKAFLAGGKDDEEGWKRLGWQRVATAELPDRVALEFGGEFAK